MPVVELLSAQFNCVMVDWPGYGKHRGKPQGHSLRHYADVLAAFLEQMSLGSVVLVGNCLGSGAALEYCHRKQPRDVAALALFNVLVPRTLGADGRLIVGWSKSRGKGLYDAVRQRIVIPKRWGRLIVWYQLNKPSRVAKPVLCHLAALNQSPENVRNLGGLVGSLKDSSHLDALSSDDAGLPPAMVVWGKKNRVLPLSAGRGFVEDFGPEEFHIEAGGHLLMLEQPAICAQRIAAFVGKCCQQQNSDVGPVQGQSKIGDPGLLAC